MPFVDPQAIAVAPGSGDVYVADGDEPGVVDVFGPDLDLPSVTTTAAGVFAGGATLNGTVDPEGTGPATCRFDWGTSEAFGNTAPCSGGVAEGNAAVAVHADIAGLAPNTTYYYRLQATSTTSGATNPGTPSQDKSFTTPGPPGESSTSSSSVGETSATLRASLDPRGSETYYYFEYGPTTSYGAKVPALTAANPRGVDIGSADAVQEVEQHIQELTGSTTYHYRVVDLSAKAGGGYEAFYGPDETFATQGPGGALSLIDGRQWELVSPPNKHGSGIEPMTAEGGTIQAAQNGSAITYVADGPVSGEPQGNRSLELTQSFSKRDAPGTWETQEITVPHSAVGEFKLGNGSEYRSFSSDLSAGLIEPRAPTQLGSEQPEREITLYLRDDATGSATPLLTKADVKSGEAFGTKPSPTNSGGIGFEGASQDLNSVVFWSESALTGEVAAPGEFNNLYEWTAGKLQLASVLPDGKPVSEEPKTVVTGEGSYLQLGYSAHLGSARKQTNAVSSDGSLVVWYVNSTTGHLYLRDMKTRETIQLDALQGVSETPENEAVSPMFQGATETPTGERVFFTDGQRLTPNSHAGHSVDSVDLYVAEVVTSPHLSVTVTDLTGDTPGEESASVQPVLGYSEDGSYIYYAADGRLTPGAPSGNCEGSNQVAECTLYVDHYSDGSWEVKRIASLVAGDDKADWALLSPTARVSPNGQFLAFMSTRSLTGYDNRDAVSGEPDEEVFLYDNATGGLVCASCNPTGARPHGVYDDGYDRHVEEASGLLSDHQNIWNERWLAGSIPGWTLAGNSTSYYQSRYLSNSGRLFFNSPDALVPQDSNGLEDVYEYEPEGVGSCDTSADAGGCVGLISSGTSREESAFVDASENGNDVFFVTAAKLSENDYDNAYDIYDAHVCSGEAPCASEAATVSPPCTTADSCRAAVTPQPGIFGSPPSATFAGMGNPAPTAPPAAKSVKAKPLTRAQELTSALKVCRKKSKKKRAACETAVRKRYGPKAKAKAKAKKASGTKKSERRGK